MSCLARATCIGRHEIVPALMAAWTQERSRPTLRFIAKKMNWRPVVVFRSVNTANLTNERQLQRMELFDFDVGFFNRLSPSKPWNSLAAIHAIERVFGLATSVNVMTHSPHLHPAVFAWVTRVINLIFPRGIRHEAMSILR